MTVFKSAAGIPPVWGELANFKIITIDKGQNHRFAFNENKNLFFIYFGGGELMNAGSIKICQSGDIIELDSRMPHYFSAYRVSQIIHLAGYWKEPSGTRGFFQMKNSLHPKNNGDPSPYDLERKTDFDNHYHDCDEYWIILQGQLKASLGNTVCILSEGDCLAIPAGEHHDMIEIYRPVNGIWFETGLRGQKRQGHLWEHRHGPYKD